MGTLSPTILGYVDAAFGSGKRTGTKPEVDFVAELKPTRLSDGATVTLYLSVYGYRKVTSNKKSPPRAELPRMKCSIVNEAWGVGAGPASPAPDAEKWVDLEQFRIGELEDGEILVHHADHDVSASDNLNAWVTDYSWGNAECNLYVGRIADAFTSWGPFFPFKVSDDPTWNRSSILFKVKPALFNLYAPAQTEILTADQVAGTLAAFGDFDNRPAYGLAFGGIATVEPASGYTELGEVSEGLAGTAVTLETGWNSSSANTSPSGSWSGGGSVGMVAVELEHDGGGSPITANELTTAASPGFPAGTSEATANVSPGTNNLLLLWVASNRYANEGDPSAPSSISWFGLTWTQVATILYASGGSGYAQRARLTLFRAMGTPTPGAGTITWPESQNEAAWSLVEFDNVTTGLDGANAIVQSITTSEAQSPDAGITSTIIGQSKPVTLGHAVSVPAYRTGPDSYIFSDGVDGSQDIDAIWEEPGVNVLAGVTEYLAASGFTFPHGKQMVCDVQGEKFNAGVYSAAQGRVANELLDRNSFSGILNSTDVGNLTDEIGLHIFANNPGTIREHLEWALRPLHHAYPEQDGSEYRILTIADPSGETADVTISYDNRDIADIERLPTAPPATRVRVGYKYQWQMLRGLEDGLTQDDRLFQRQQWAYAEDASILTNYPNALRLQIVTPLYDATEAQTAADALLAIFKVRRDLFRVKVAKQFLAAWIGDFVSITYPGYGLSGGKVMLCVGVEVDLRGPDVWWTLWG